MRCRASAASIRRPGKDDPQRLGIGLPSARRAPAGASASDGGHRAAGLEVDDADEVVADAQPVDRAGDDPAIGAASRRSALRRARRARTDRRSAGSSITAQRGVDDLARRARRRRSPARASQRERGARGARRARPRAAARTGVEQASRARPRRAARAMAAAARRGPAPIADGLSGRGGRSSAGAGARAQSGSVIGVERPAAGADARGARPARCRASCSPSPHGPIVRDAAERRSARARCALCQLSSTTSPRDGATAGDDQPLGGAGQRRRRASANAPRRSDSRCASISAV